MSSRFPVWDYGKSGICHFSLGEASQQTLKTVEPVEPYPFIDLHSLRGFMKRLDGLGRALPLGSEAVFSRLSRHG
jgi:hypothetical protein